MFSRAGKGQDHMQIAIDPSYMIDLSSKESESRPASDSATGRGGPQSVSQHAGISKGETQERRGSKGNNAKGQRTGRRTVNKAGPT